MPLLRLDTLAQLVLIKAACKGDQIALHLVLRSVSPTGRDEDIVLGLASANSVASRSSSAATQGAGSAALYGSETSAFVLQATVYKYLKDNPAAWIASLEAGLAATRVSAC